MDGESSLKQHLEAIKQASIHLSELTQQMLVYAGRGHAVVAPLDLSALVSELSTLLMASLSKKIALRLELAADLGLVEADAGKVQQLVLNLITNAAEAIGDASGTVVVRTALVSRDWVEAKGAWVGSPLSSQSYVLFEVSDDGCGMDDETRVRMFDPFFTTKVTGRGLGLAAVLGIMRSHKGAIRFDSQLGAGSTGRAIFPCEAGALKVDSSPPLSINGVRRQGTVLLVDDEELVRHVSTLLLQSVGYTVEIACDGAAALDILRQRRNRIQLVVIDMLMPGMTGAETLAEIRRTWTDLPVILSSGYGEVADGLVSNWSRAAFLQKPYTISQLLERIDRLLEP